MDRYYTEFFRSLLYFHHGFRIFHILSTFLNDAYSEAEFRTLYLQWRQEAGDGKLTLRSEGLTQPMDLGDKGAGALREDRSLRH